MTETLLTEGITTPLIDTNKDYFTELVGDGKKFKTPQELAKAKQESDLYIQQLTRRIDEMRDDHLKLREDYNSRAKLEEVMETYSKQFQSAEPKSSNEDTIRKPEFDPNEVKSLISSELRAFNAQQKEEQNFNTVKTKLIERFGNNYQSVYKEQIDSLGLSKEVADEMARKQPNVFIKALGLDTPQRQENFQSPPRSERNSSSFAPTVEKRTWAYYQKMKKEEPTRYHNPKTQVQLHHDAIALGDEFKDGNWREI